MSARQRHSSTRLTIRREWSVRPLRRALGLVAGLLAAGASAAAPDKVALVIGNGAYDQLPLRNPVSDARAMATSLKDLGFEVMTRENANLGGTLDAMREFLAKSKDAKVRLFYFAGHGAQFKGRNYLIPTDVALQEEGELPRKSADATELVERLGRLSEGVNLVILDACRNQPFPVGTRTRNPLGGLATRSLAPGLAQLGAPRGTLVAFSTAPGSVALDGPSGNSPYTRHLVETMRVPGLPVEQVFKRVRQAVAEETGRAQIPWESSSLLGDYCFRSGPGGACAGGAGSLAPTASLVARQR